MKRISRIWGLLALLCTSCFQDNARDLEQMHINGNVVKIETVSLTTIPVTEMLMNSSPQLCIAQADGNYTLTFNHRGNIKRYQGFGVDNDLLFDVKPQRGNRIMMSNVSMIENYDDFNYELNENGDVVSMEFFENDTLVRRTSIRYDSHGRIVMIVGRTGKLWGDLFAMNDTTLYRYIRFDDYNNWTEMEVEQRHNILPERNNVTYSVLRQITYRGEKKKEPLMNQPCSQIIENPTTHRLFPIRLGNIGTISVPEYMVPSNMDGLKSFTKIANLNSSIYDNDLCRYQYKDESKYATLSVEYIADAGIGWDEFTEEDLEYDEELDNELKLQHETPEAQKIYHLIKWYPYRIVRVDRHWALCIRYIRLAKGSGIPVYVESYMLDSPDGGAISITMSYQVNRRDYFHQDLTNAVQSITFSPIGQY